MSQTPPSNANGWYKSASESKISAYQNGVFWSPVKKPTTIHRYFTPVTFSPGSHIDFSLNWQSDGDVGNQNRELECSNANPTKQGKGISDSYLRCLAGTGDFRIGFFQSNRKTGDNTCEGNHLKDNCQAPHLPTKDFNDYRGFQFRIQPHLSAGYGATQARLMEDHGNGKKESHINLNLWSRIGAGENGLMSDECQAIDHCGYSKGDGWGTEPVSWAPNMPFGVARPLKVQMTRVSDSDFEVVVTMNGNRSPVLRGRFPDNFRPDYFDTIAITYTNSSRRYEYVGLTDFSINGNMASAPAPGKALISGLTQAYSAIPTTQNLRLYSDRDYSLIGALPDQFSDGYFIQSRNADSNSAKPNLLSFTLLQDSDVFVLYDQRVSAESTPLWLQSWMLTNDVVQTTDSPRRVYRKRFPAGPVTLGGNAPARSMYSVVVTRKPLNEAPKCEIGNLVQLVTGAVSQYKAKEVLGSEPLSYRWDFGDGGSIATAAEATRGYGVAGSYLVRLTLNNSFGSASCSATQKVLSPFPPPAFQFAHYRFENSMNDSSGFGYHGKIGNRASYSDITREGRNALKLDGSEKDYLALPTALASSEDFSFAAWVRWHGGDSWQNIFSAGRDEDNVMFLTVSDSSNRLRFRIERNGIKQELLSNVSLARWRYYHVAVTLKGERATLYLDGKAVAQSDNVSFDPRQLAATNVWLGRSHFNDPYFDGRMDDVRFYGRALTSDEVNTLAR